MITQEEIEDIVSRIASICLPEKIILFGSYAYGNPEEDSDLDLLVVLPFTGHSTLKAVEILEKVCTTLPVDLIIRTPEQLAARLALNDFFLQEVVEKGKVIYQAAS